MSEPDTIKWDEIHRLIQLTLAELAKQVYAKRPEVRTTASSTAARVWYLFSYCDFAIPSDHAIESVTAGIIFLKVQGEETVSICGDIVREEGDILFETPLRVVPKTRAEILAVAEEAALALSKQAPLILAELKTTGRS